MTNTEVLSWREKTSKPGLDADFSQFDWQKMELV